ncbi:MAG: hypothetical protein ACI9CD_000906 [Candidatus Deianiraeaceae bacterium]|jgi:hypothetical protein
MKPRQETQTYRALKSRVVILNQELNKLHSDNQDKYTSWMNNISSTLQAQLNNIVQWGKKPDKEKKAVRVFAPRATTVRKVEDLLQTLKGQKEFITTQIQNHQLDNTIQVCKKAVLKSLKATIVASKSHSDNQSLSTTTMLASQPHGDNQNLSTADNTFEVIASVHHALHNASQAINLHEQKGGADKVEKFARTRGAGKVEKFARTKGGQAR